MAPMFRYERPQSGRLRQFHQLGVEVSVCPATDVETIAMAWDLLKELGLSNMRLVINSTPGKTADRIKYREALITSRTICRELSEDSKNRLGHKTITCIDSKDKRDIDC